MVVTLTPEQMADRVGTETVSDWVEVTQTMIDQFADATGDHQFIHIDPVRAARTPFGGTVAHGFLTLSLLSKLAGDVAGRPTIGGATMSVNYGMDRLRFLSPVPAGSRVRAHFKLLTFEQKRPGQYQQSNAVTVEIEGHDKPALIAEWIGQTFV